MSAGFRVSSDPFVAVCVVSTTTMDACMRELASGNVHGMPIEGRNVPMVSGI